MSINNKIIEYMRLLRIHLSVHTASMLLLGALVMGQSKLSLLIPVFFIGLLGHFFGFVLNDYMDIEIDRTSFELKKKPLVSGTISKQHALAIVILAGFLSYLLTIYFFMSILSILLLTSAALLGIIYNVFGKKIPGLEFIASGSLALFFLFGASTVTSQFTILIYLIGSALFIDFIFLHTIEGGLKDVEHDYKAGAKNLATVLGISVKNKNLVTSIRFLSFAYILKTIFIVLILLLSFQPEINLWHADNYLMQVIVIFLLVVMIITTYKLTHITSFSRAKVKKIYISINSVSLALIIVLLLPVIGIWFTIVILILPISWYIVFNYILHRLYYCPM